MLKASRALLSVYDKRGLPELAQGLVALGVELLSTGGTYRTLEEAGVPVLAVSARVIGVALCSEVRSLRKRRSLW